MAAAITGMSEKLLVRAGRPYQKVYVHPAKHADYYPGARPMTIKLLFEPGRGTILGAQIVGEEGVDTRIDVLAMALQARMTVFDLEEAELAYSPQFGSAKDAVNMAGFVASGVARGDYAQVHVEDLPALVREPSMMLVDVRTRTEYDGGAIPARSTSHLMSCAIASTPCLRAVVSSSTARPASAATSPPDCSATWGTTPPISAAATRCTGCPTRIGRAIHLDWIPRIGQPPGSSTEKCQALAR